MADMSSDIRRFFWDFTRTSKNHCKSVLATVLRKKSCKLCRKMHNRWKNQYLIALAGTLNLHRACILA